MCGKGVFHSKTNKTKILVRCRGSCRQKVVSLLQDDDNHQPPTNGGALNLECSTLWFAPGECCLNLVAPPFGSPPQPGECCLVVRTRNVRNSWSVKFSRTGMKISPSMGSSRRETKTSRRCARHARPRPNSHKEKTKQFDPFIREKHCAALLMLSHGERLAWCGCNRQLPTLVNILITGPSFAELSAPSPRPFHAEIKYSPLTRHHRAAGRRFSFSTWCQRPPHIQDEPGKSVVF